MMDVACKALFFESILHSLSDMLISVLSKGNEKSPYT